MKDSAELTKILLNLNVNDYVEKKGRLSYLSWANAWKEFIKVYPDATYDIEVDENNFPAFHSEEIEGYICYTSVTARGITHKMWLPVMNNKNQANVSPTVMDINKTIMRCLTKNLAMFGLGLYIYAGEDLPDDDETDNTKKTTTTTKKTVLPKKLSREELIKKFSELPSTKSDAYIAEYKKLENISANKKVIAMYIKTYFLEIVASKEAW